MVKKWVEGNFILYSELVSYPQPMSFMGIPKTADGGFGCAVCGVEVVIKG